MQVDGRSARVHPSDDSGELGPADHCTGLHSRAVGSVIPLYPDPVPMRARAGGVLPLPHPGLRRPEKEAAQTQHRLAGDCRPAKKCAF